MTPTPPTMNPRRFMARTMCASLLGSPALVLMLAGCATLPHGDRGEKCRDAFLSQMKDATIEARVELSRKLTPSDLRCLLDASKGHRVTSDTFFLSPERRKTRRVQRFAGKNDQFAPFSTFEKQMFVIDEAGTERLYGYNTSPLGRTAKSPGWFRFDDANGEAVLDYRADFVSILAVPEVAAQVRQWSGYAPIAIANNDGSLLFGNLQDTLFLLDEDAAIGSADRVKEGKRSEAASFILVRAN